MLFMNFILNENQEAECVGYSIKPTTEFGLMIQKYPDHNKNSSTELIIRQGHEHLKNLISPQLEPMMMKAILLLRTIKVEDLVEQIKKNP